MKNKFFHCFRPVVVEAEESALSQDPVSADIVHGGNSGKIPSSTGKSSSISGHKNRKLFPRFKNFPGLIKAIFFQHPPENVDRFELQLKSKQRECFNVLERDSGNPEIIADVSENRQEETSSISSEAKTLGLSNEKPEICCCSSRRVSSFWYTIAFALLATVVWGRTRAIIILVTVGLGSVHWWWSGHFRRPLDRTKSDAAAAPRGKHDEPGKS